MDNPAAKKAAKKHCLHEKHATAHISTAVGDTATLNISNPPAMDPSATTKIDTNNFDLISTATPGTSKNITPAPLQLPELLWDSLSDTHQEAGNYYYKQQLPSAPIAASSIIEPTETATAPKYTETAMLPAQPASDNGETVEQVNTKLLHMEQYWAKSQSSLFPKSIRSMVADLRLAVERRETEAAWNAAVQVCAVQAAEMEENEEESEEESTEGEEDERQQRGEKEQKGIEKEVKAREQETE